MREYVVIATWPFGQTAVKAAAAILEQGKSALDAVVAGVQAVEDDPHVNSVGFGGLPNAIGRVQLDACVMEGKTLGCGAVAGVENVRHATALARRVMEKTPHVMLVGEGARCFAVHQGFPLENLETPASLAEWEERRSHTNRGNVPPQRRAESALDTPFSHDTVTVLAMDRAGSLAGACSTSGLAHKLPGRVGDSPIIGAGLYVDDSAGAAGGTGVGEEIIRIGGSLRVVEWMRAGASAQEACERAVCLVNQIAQRRDVPPARVAFIALEMNGVPAAACTKETDFHYAVGRPGKVELFRARELEFDKRLG
jgi:isoaspartyl peptidase/L-asparaginase-like protein (Ntn-hydrolase superfamily)